MQTRQFLWEDLPQIVEFMNRYAEFNGRSANITIEQIERSWRTPYNHPEDDAFVAIEEGQIIGYTIADLLDEPHYAYGVYQVMPNHHQAAKELMDVATERFRGVASQKSLPEVQIALDWMIPQANSEGIALCEAQGFPLVRQFYKMRIALGNPISVPPLPEGFVRQPFHASQLEEVFSAKVEIFQDHWGDQHDTVDEWQHIIEHDSFDPDFWWIIYGGDEIAGLLLSQPLNTRAGNIGILGVKRTWRKRGLAQALLRQCFAAYQQCGLQDIYLDVDSDSPTNAVSLYERVGMQTHRRTLYYRHVLRAAQTR